MKKQLIFCLLGFICIIFLYGHEGHQKPVQKRTEEIVAPNTVPQTVSQLAGGRPKNWAQWIGGFHFIFLHFPIALIIMTCISEFLLVWNQKSIFDYAARFMLIAAAVSAIPTAISGLIYHYTFSYEGYLANLVWWHMWAGISTAFFVIIAVILRYYYGTNQVYCINLFTLFLLVNVTGYLGGTMTFGLYHMYPPSTKLEPKL